MDSPEEISVGTNFDKTSSEEESLPIREYSPLDSIRPRMIISVINLLILIILIPPVYFESFEMKHPDH